MEGQSACFLQAISCISEKSDIVKYKAPVLLAVTAIALQPVLLIFMQTQTYFNFVRCIANLSIPVQAKLNPARKVFSGVGSNLDASWQGICRSFDNLL